MKYDLYKILLIALTLFVFSCSDNNNDPDGERGGSTDPTSLLTVPDKDGMTIKGVVYCDNEPIFGVVVSDGVNVSTTDKNGVYYLRSTKENGYVFVSIPSGYSVPSKGMYPQFFGRLTAAASTVEQVNFELKKSPAGDYVVIALADIHLAKRNEDLGQFESVFLPDIKATINDYRAQGKNVHLVTLGDESWDLYWYSNSFAIPEVMSYLEKIGSPIMNCMGNHDNDPYYANDFKAAQAWRDIVGPNYYSFNIGEVHYVVLDNVNYVNTGGTIGTEGERDYTSDLTATQLSWLNKDLTTITNKSKPLVICMHVPLYTKPKIVSSGKVNHSVNMDKGDQLISALSAFTDVRILTGHAHVNYVVEENNGRIIEYNTGAACASWWWTGKSTFAKNHIARDGSVGGYRVLEVSGRNIKAYFKGIGYDRNYQFRAYDLNEVELTAAKYCPKSTDAALSEWAYGFDKPNKKNEVLINVWGYDERWKIEVTENGKPLEVTRVNQYDPLHIISCAAKRLDTNGSMSDSLAPSLTAHMFMVTASSATSTLNIKVTDENGNVYTETMTRPKSLTTGMK